VKDSGLHAEEKPRIEVLCVNKLLGRMAGKFSGVTSFCITWKI